MRSGTDPLSLAALDSCSPFCRLPATSSPGRGKSFEGESPWQNQQVSSTPVNGRKKPAVKQQTFRLCQSLSLSGEVARRSRDGEGRFRDEPSQSRCARQLDPLFVAYRRHLPPAGGSLSKGRALGRTGKFRPHRSTAGRSLPLSSKLFAFAKASPFRERWHGEAVTERVAFGTNPLSRLRRQLSRRGELLAEPASFVHTGQRQKKSTDNPKNFTPLPKPPPSGEVARRSRDGEGLPIGAIRWFSGTSRL